MLALLLRPKQAPRGLRRMLSLWTAPRTEQESPGIGKFTPTTFRLPNHSGAGGSPHWPLLP